MERSVTHRRLITYRELEHTGFGGKLVLLMCVLMSLARDCYHGSENPTAKEQDSHFVDDT